ncbi:MAG: protein-glutamate O-methyltransferase [Pseudomonadota bacterium]
MKIDPRMPARFAQPGEFSKADFEYVASFAREKFGLSLSEAKLPLVKSRVSRRLRSLGLADFTSYRAFLEGAEGGAEESLLLSALTTNVTSFFREKHHFDQLRDRVLPPLIDKAKKGQTVRIWSAACSTGPEPYSIAMVIRDLCGHSTPPKIEIVATDIDPVVIEKAKSATYAAQDRAQIPQPYVARYTKPGAENTFRIECDTRKLVKFGTENLIKPHAVSGLFDVIFCRNAAIYFDHETQARLWERFARSLHTGGVLFIGHSERVHGPALRHLKNDGITTYKKEG